MDDVRADGDVDRDRDSQPPGGGEKAQLLMGKIGFGDHPADARADAEPFGRSLADRPVDERARLPRGSEAPVADGVGDLLGRPSGEGDFEIVDDPRPVQGQALDPAAFHEVDENGLKADLDDVGAAPEQDGLPLPVRLGASVRRTDGNPGRPGHREESRGTRRRCRRRRRAWRTPRRRPCFGGRAGIASSVHRAWSADSSSRSAPFRVGGMD